MITFDDIPYDPRPLEGMMRAKLPDTIEIGERNDCWMRVVRSKRRFEMVDKVTGKVTTIVMDQHFPQIAQDRYRIDRKQVLVAIGTLTL